jgi:hypothetical protein
MSGYGLDHSGVITGGSRDCAIFPTMSQTRSGVHPAPCPVGTGSFSTNSIEQSPSEDNSHSASQEILRPLWNTNVQCRVHKDPPLPPVLSQMHPIQTFPPSLPNIPSNTVNLVSIFSIACFVPRNPSKSEALCNIS